MTLFSEMISSTTLECQTEDSIDRRVNREICPSFSQRNNVTKLKAIGSAQSFGSESLEKRSVAKDLKRSDNFLSRLSFL